MSQNYTVSFTVDQTPEQVFAAVLNPRAWWSEEIEGTTDELNGEFIYRSNDLHRSTQKLTAIVPNEKVVWQIVDSHLSFIEDKSEWTGTDVVFEIGQVDGKTELRFTHVGLLPAIECYDACSHAWDFYVRHSLLPLITRGVGEPDSREHARAAERRAVTLAGQMPAADAQTLKQNFTTSFTVPQSPDEVFAAINNVRGWWSKAVEGTTDKLGAEWNYHYKDVHRLTMQVTDLIPGKKVAWKVLDNYFNFTKDETEWIGNELIFDIVENGDQTEVRFTQVGLVPEYECFDICSNAWGVYITQSLRNLIMTGEGQPNQEEERGWAEQAAISAEQLKVRR